MTGFRLSPQQERSLAIADGGSPTQCAALIAGVDEDRLRGALESVVARHEILRTTFSRPAGMRTPQQVVHEHLPPEWSSEDASWTDPVPGADGLRAALAREAERGFDLERGPLVRGLLTMHGREQGLLVLTSAGACADGISLLLLLDELADVYHGHGGSSEPVQYADYAEWRHQLTTDEEAEAHEGRALWREESLGRPPHPRLLGGWSLTAAGGPASVPLDLGLAEVDALRGAADGVGTTPAIFIEAAWHTLLARLSGSTELLVAGWSHGRSQPELESAIGAYAQPAPIRSHFEDETSFAEILDQVRRARSNVARSQDYAAAADLSALTRAAGIGFSAVTIGPPREPIVRAVAVTLPAEALPLMLGVRLSDAGIEVELRYEPIAFDRRYAEDIARRLRTMLVSAAADAGRPVSRLAISEPAERAQILSRASGPPSAEDSTLPFHHLFAKQAERTPDRPAVSGGAVRMTYAQLNVAANQLAHRLRELGVGRGVTVGLCMGRTPSMLVAVIGILKAGGAYLPLNLEHPMARLAHQLREAGAPVLVTEQRLVDRFASVDCATVCLDRDADELSARPMTNPEQVASADDLAYVMYTSGSTGTPKGVAVTHGNLSNYATYMVQRLGLADPAAAGGLRFGVVSAISTDLGNTGIFPPLLSGCHVQLISAEASMEAEALTAELDGCAIDVVKIAPSHLRALLGGPCGAEVLPRRWLVLGGEALTWELVETIRSLSRGCRIINHYGPTETTIGCCTYDVDAERRPECATVPIGSAIAGNRAYILDRHGEPVPPGVPGEICIAGAGVAAGYVGDAGDPGRRFGADSLGGDGSSRMYRTGDRGRYLGDGVIEFLGRFDDQVKIRGFRIEPAEIEAALVAHPDIRQAAVTTEEDERGQARLVGYLVSSVDFTVGQLRALLAETLPDYMIPARFAALDQMPFTPSGKIDRGALGGLAAVEAGREARYVAPRDPVEEEIAALWRELLGVDRVGVHDDFFALGGHSLLATQAIMRIRRLHGDIPLRALLAAPTVAALAEVVRSTRGTVAAGHGEGQ